MLSGAAVVDTLAATVPMAKCISSRPSIAQAIVFRRTAFATTKGFPTLTVVRDALVPAANLGSGLAFPLFFVGMLFDSVPDER